MVKKEYRGQRSPDALSEYIKSQLEDTIKQHSTMDELEELEVKPSGLFKVIEL